MAFLFRHKALVGHVLALLTVMIWGSAFVFTKTLLEALSPLEILFFRFLIGYGVLLLLHPRFYKTSGAKEELSFAIAALLGIVIYQLAENVALIYTTASNVGMLGEISPLFTALLVMAVDKTERVHKSFFVGFAIAAVGLVLVIYNGQTALQLNPLGDIIALCSAIFWAAYSVFIKRINAYQYNPFYATRKIFFYAVLMMVPLSFVMDFRYDVAPLFNLRVLGGILFLAVLCSSLTFAAWNVVTENIGAVKAAAYTYLIPVVSIVVSAIFLKERVTLLIVCGCAFILLGVYISDRKPGKKEVSGGEEELRVACQGSLEATQEI